MANYFDNVPQAVATIVAASWGAVVSTRMQEEEKQKRVIDYTDQVTRTIMQAMIDKMNGK